MSSRSSPSAPFKLGFLTSSFTIKSSTLSLLLPVPYALYVVSKKVCQFAAGSSPTPWAYQSTRGVYTTLQKQTDLKADRSALSQGWYPLQTLSPTPSCLCQPIAANFTRSPAIRPEQLAQPAPQQIRSMSPLHSASKGGMHHPRTSGQRSRNSVRAEPWERSGNYAFVRGVDLDWCTTDTCS